MSDFLEKFKLYFKNQPDYWEIRESAGEDYKVGYYPISFKARLSQGHYQHFDDKGLPLFHSKAGNLVHFCTGMCSFAFAHWEEYLDSKKRSHADYVLKVSDYLVGMAEKRDSGVWLIMDYDDEEQVNGQPCAMNNGEAISVLCRAYVLTGKSEYLEAASSLVLAFKNEYGLEGVSGSIKHNGLVWYLEAGKFILNGHNYALFGLHELSTLTDDPLHLKLFRDGLNSLCQSVHLFDCGFWSWYWLNEPKYISSAMYHNLHSTQLMALYRMSDEEVLKKYSNVFRYYAGKPSFRYRAAFTMLKDKILKTASKV